MDQEKPNPLFNLVNHQPNIDKIYLYAEDPYKAKHHLLINQRESAVLKHLDDFKVFIGYSKDMDNIFKNM